MEREKALEMALGQIEKQYGKGSVMKMGEKSSMDVETVPTGALSLDIALGVGGLPRSNFRSVAAIDRSDFVRALRHDRNEYEHLESL